jgi:Domain of unknown function DUF29
VLSGRSLRERYVAWSEQQAEALRAAARGRSNRPLDLENLAEEIEGLGISQRSALGSQIRRIVHRLLNLQYSGAHEPRGGWEGSIIDARNEIEDLLERSPSLAIAAVHATVYTEGQVVGHWFPPNPTEQPRAEKP